MSKKTAVVICPGRGTYQKNEFGCLKPFYDTALLNLIDRVRAQLGLETVSALDSADKYLPARHQLPVNNAALIYAAGLCQFNAINPDEYEVVAVTGNSMGWYSALACAGAALPEDGFRLANTMGRLMQEALIGGQSVYPWVGDDWVPDPARKASLLALITDVASRPGHVLALSIDLGGLLVIAGNDAGLKAFESSVPPLQGRFPMRLGNHAAFHTELQTPVAAKGRDILPLAMFTTPSLPMVDGRGHVWWPGVATPAALRDYTLGHQVVQPYDFTAAIRSAAREFAPDLFIVTGPGSTLGGAVAQSLIQTNWRGMASKADFQRLQTTAPILISMGLPDQRGHVTPKGATP